MSTKVTLTGSGVVGLAAVVGVIGLALYLYGKRKEIVAAVNPASDQNLAYKASNKVTELVTGDSDATTGTAIYDAFHNGDGSFRLPWQTYVPYQ
jgi:hypothetical protein